MDSHGVLREAVAEIRKIRKRGIGRGLAMEPEVEARGPAWHPCGNWGLFIVMKAWKRSL